MGRLGKIEQIVNDTINHYAHVKIFPRGLPRYVDPLLRGTVRFAKRSGNTISLLNPDNTYKFATVPQTRDNKFVLDNLNKWIIEDCILSMGPERELHQVHDIVDTTVLLKSNLTQTYTTDDKVLLHSYPMLLSIDVNAGDTTIMVKSHYNIANGDVFAYLQDQTLLQSLTEIKVTKATRLGSVGSVFFDLLYLLDLEKPVQRYIQSNTMVYLRAYPAYFSAAVRVPNALFTSEPIGPFLLDLLTGRLLEGTEFNETFAIRTLNRGGSYTLGNSTSYVTVDKNYLVLERTVPVHAPMFWELAEGSMRLTPSRIVLKVNSTLSFDNTGLVTFQYGTSTFDNTNLVTFTYSSLTGVVQYSSSVNLSRVSSGNLFMDGAGIEYKITNVTTGSNSITISTQSGSLPSTISTSVITHLDGSIRINNGVVQYRGSVNLAKVGIGNLFRDGAGVEYKVIDVDTTYNNVTILTQSGDLPALISTSIVSHLDGSIRMITENKFCAGIKCIPALSADHSWRVSLLSNEDCTIRFIFTPNDPQEFTLVSGISKNVVITIPAGNEVTNIEINILSLANICAVRMNEWSPVKDTVEQIEYSFVVEAIGTGTYQASGLIIKPYFMGSEFLKTSYDINATYDSGKIYF